MPFQSEKQRRYLHANHPEIAKRWERDYAGGGLIPAHQAGIYGLAEGGRTGFFTAGLAQDDISPGTSVSGGTRSGGDGGYQNVHQTGAVTQTPGRPVYQDRIIETQDRQRKQDLSDIITRGKEEKIDYVEPPQKTNWLKTLGTLAAVYTGVAPILGIQAPTVVKLAADANTLYKNIDRGVKLGQKFNIIPKDFSTDEYLASIKNNALEYQKKKRVYDSLPDGHPEKIALSVELEIGKKPEHLGDGGDDVSIKYTSEEITDTNDAKAELASSRWRRKQEEVDRSKQMAYWRMMMAPYMSAQGGRVPQGYNTGGLSNLFRLKNR